MQTRSPESVAAEVEALLERAADSALALAARLADERRALEAEDLDELSHAAAAKQASLGELEALEVERRALLGGCGLGDDTAGMQALLAAGDDAATLHEKWRRYLGLAADCRRENLTNGAIIRLRCRQLTATLEALSGVRTATYGPDGSAGSAPSRSLAEA